MHHPNRVREALIGTIVESLHDEFMSDPERQNDTACSNLSVFGRSLWRHAEGTLGEYVSPYWREKVLPALARVDEKDRPFVALALAGLMLSTVFEFGLSWASLSGTLPASASSPEEAAAA